MQPFDTRNEQKNMIFRPRLMDRLIYIPGAVIMLYGLWLALTV